MKFEKRSEGPQEPSGEQGQEMTPAGKKPVVIYIMILFIVAFLLMALHDEKYEIQRAVLKIISRLSPAIPGVVTNAVRQLILDLLRALEYSQETSTIIESVKLLGLSIHSTSSLIEAYVNPVFELLVNHLKTIQHGAILFAGGS